MPGGLDHGPLALFLVDRQSFFRDDGQNGLTLRELFESMVDLKLPRDVISFSSWGCSRRSVS